MAILVEEKWDSGSGDYGQAEKTYVISGTDDPSAARSALAGAAPGTYEGMPLDATSPHVERLTPDIWLGRVTYKDDSKSGGGGGTGTSSWSFDTSGGTQHITQALATIGDYALDGSDVPPNMEGAIGYDGEIVQGVDVTVPCYSFAETHYLPDSTVNNTYKGTLFALTGTVNSGAFKGCAAGECLFLGATGSKRRAEGDWEITYRFAASPNRTLTIAGNGGIAKKGWEYLWVLYTDQDDTSAKMRVKKPKAAYVVQVYEYGNFGALGIGTT